MGVCQQTIMLVIWIFAFLSGVLAESNNSTKTGKAFSLFSIVQFPNQQCTSASSSSTYGTCYTASECSSKGGSTDGNCAAGFGVCCVITTTTCGSTISTNTTYIRNPGYPSSYTASSAGSCSFTIKKVADDICQLRLDFQTFSGFATTSPAGACDDTFAATGQTGSDPPSICGTNTGYHMYVEFGTTSTDSITLTNTYTSTEITTSKSYNILARQMLVQQHGKLQQTVCSGSRVQQDQSKVTILAVVKFCEDKFTTTASELRPAIVQFSGKSHQPHHQIHLMLEPEPPLMRQLVLVPSFSFQT